MLYKLVKALPPSTGFNHSVIALTNGKKFDFETLGVPVKFLKVKHLLSSPVALWKLRRMVADATPDVVQGWMYHGNVAAALGTGRGVPVVWNIRHSLHDLSREKFLNRVLIRGCCFLTKRVKKIVYCSQVSRKQHEEIGYPAEKSVIIPNGFDCAQFRPDQKARRMLREILSLANDTLVVGHAARYHPMKNHSGLLRAFSTVAAQFPGVHLFLVGRDVTKENTQLFKCVTQTGAGDRIHLLGELDDLTYIFPALDIYVSASLWGEAFPNVLGEAMACGVPCVTTDVGDSAAIVGDTGRVVPAGDDAALAVALCEMLALPPKARRDLGKHARSRVLEEFKMQAVADCYAGIYKRLANQPLPPEE